MSKEFCILQETEITSFVAFTATFEELLHTWRHTPNLWTSKRIFQGLHKQMLSMGQIKMPMYCHINGVDNEICFFTGHIISILWSAPFSLLEREIQNKNQIWADKGNRNKQGRSSSNSSLWATHLWLTVVWCLYCTLPFTLLWNTEKSSGVSSR